MTTTRPPEPPHEALERLFHEPARLAEMSHLCAAPDGLPFTTLRDACRLTDGNLNRHLKALREAGVVSVRKAFVRERPVTTVLATARGAERFGEYLDALAAVLREARRALPAERPAPAAASLAAGRRVPV